MIWKIKMDKTLKKGPSNPSREESRGAFRIDDTLSVIIRKVEEKPCVSEPETAADDLSEIDPWVLEKENISPTLWKMMVNLNRKLDRLLKKIPVDLFTVKPQPVNLSSTGLELKVKRKFDLDELVRVKILLPTLPVKELVVESKVVRIVNLEGGEYEVGLHFQNLDDTVKSEILQYTLTRQRTILTEQRKKRFQDDSEPGKRF